MHYFMLIFLGLFVHVIAGNTLFISLAIRENNYFDTYCAITEYLTV